MNFKTSWTSKNIGKEKPIYYIKHKPASTRACYFFLLVNPNKEKALKKVMDGDQTFDLIDYGEIIESGYGEEAPEQVIEWVTNWYNKKP